MLSQTVHMGSVNLTRICSWLPSYLSSLSCCFVLFVFPYLLGIIKCQGHQSRIFWLLLLKALVCNVGNYLSSCFAFSCPSESQLEMLLAEIAAFLADPLQ